MLSLDSITKRFGPVEVLKGVSFDIRPGEVHALLGENGAGKSTIMKIVSGYQPPSGGRILLDGEAVRFASVADATRQGVRMLYQELALAPDLTVAENLYLGELGKWIADGPLLKRAGEHLRSLGLDLDPGAVVNELSVGRRQMVAIARALTGTPRFLVLDEPTAPLTGHETEQLFGFVQRIRAAGVGIVYISHRLEEVFRIADRVTVLRDGRHIATSAVSETSPEQVVEWMVGRSVLAQSRVNESVGESRWRVQVSPERASGSELTLQAGEVVGLLGIVGSGRTDFTRALYGVAGSSNWNGTRVTSPAAAARLGIGFVPEDRKTEGAALPRSIEENVVLSNLASVAKGGLIQPRLERAQAERWVRALSIRPNDVNRPVELLSGGNQQKVVLARVLAAKPAALVLEEPTRGVDIGAREEIYELIAELARGGMPIVISSGDVLEVLSLANRVLIFRRGEIVKELFAPLDHEEVVAYVAGANAA
jgi:ABC-type sugar transport system ATPase subunit